MPVCLAEVIKDARRGKGRGKGTRNLHPRDRGGFERNLEVLLDDRRSRAANAKLLCFVWGSRSHGSWPWSLATPSKAQKDVLHILSFHAAVQQRDAFMKTCES